MLENMGNEFLPSCSGVVLDETVGERKIFYRLSESELFTYANKMTTLNGQKLIDVIPRMVVPDQGFIQLTYDKFSKDLRYELFESNKYKISCKKEMRDMLETGKVIPVYSHEYKLPTAIPYIAQTSGKNVTIYVNVTDFIDLDNYGNANVTVMRNYGGLMAILFAACASYGIIRSNQTLPADISDGMVIMYAMMLTKVINSIVHMDPVSNDKVKYLSAEFALIQMYGTQAGSTLFERYKQKYFPKLSKLIIDSIDNDFHIDSFDNFSGFIEELKRLYPSMRGLTNNMVYDKWIRKYGASTALSIDYLGYHLYTLCMLLFESPLVSRIALEPMLDKSLGTNAYKRLQLLIESIK